MAAGDTLQTIAKGAYGDANLWYLIADANGLSSNGDLRAGQVLTIPTAVGSANSANTFRPYDPSRITGNTSPTLMAQPGGQDKGCGAIGAIIVVIIAVVVTVITEGATSELLAESIMSSAGSMSAAEFATAAAVSNVAAGVAGAVAGSIASQAVGVAIGAQDSFSWKGVALAAVSGGVSGGLGGWAPLGSEATVGNAIVRSAVGSSLTQGIAVATGLQSSFSWSQVAASAIGAGVGSAVSSAVGSNLSFGNEAFGKFANGAVSGFAGGLATAAMRGGKISVTQVAADAFGNALGESLAGANGQSSRTNDLDAFLALNDNFSGVDANGGAIMINGQTFSQNAAATRAAGNPAGLPTYVGNGGAPAGYGIELSGNGILGWQDRVSAQPSTVRAGDFGGSMERIARAQLGSGASQRDINNYVGQLIEINGISNPRRVGGDLDITLPGASTPAATSGLGVYGKDIALGEQMKAAARAELTAASAQAATNANAGFADGRDARDMRLSFGYQSMMSRELGDAADLADYQRRLATGPQLTAWDGITRDAPAVAYLKQSLGGLDPVRGDQMQFRVAQMLPDAALNEVGGLVAGKIIGRVLGWGDQVAARVTSLDSYEALQIVNTKKGLRPLPETYMPQSMLDEHAVLFESGAARIQPNLPTGTIGRTETWVMPKPFADKAIAEAGGDVGKLEQLLGLDKGYLGNSPLRVYIPQPAGLRMSSGNEYGANHLWNPGGYTNGGIPEAVINPVPPGAYTVAPIKVR